MNDREDLEEFVTIQSQSQKNMKEKQLLPYSQVMETCRQMSDNILYRAMKKNTLKLLDLVKTNDGSNKAQIYPILLKDNQIEHLPIFLQILNDQLDQKIKAKEEKQKIFVELKEDDIWIKCIEGTDVRDIALKIYLDTEETLGKPDFTLYIYFIKDVTDLSENNLYVFSKSITNKNFIAFVPTFETFDDDNYQGIERLNYEKYINPIYKSKEVFCSYFLECLTNPIIKAYLPPQSTKLISDLDYYCLGYSQSCRRLNYVIERCLYLNSKERPSIESIKINQLIECVQRTIKKTIWYYDGYRSNYERIIRIILDEKESYRIPERILTLELQMREKIHSQSEDEVITKMRGSLCKNLQKIDPNYAKILSDQNFQIDSKQTKGYFIKKRKDRSDILGLNSKPNHTPKMKLQTSISRLIKNVTIEIRRFASTIKWKNICFQERISPCIPFEIVSSMKEDDEIMGLVDDVVSNFTIPISNLLSLFPEDQVGYGFYLIKTLELSGLFTLSKRQINPLVYNNFFEKAKFNKGVNKHK